MMRLLIAMAALASVAYASGKQCSCMACNARSTSTIGAIATDRGVSFCDTQLVPSFGAPCSAQHGAHCHAYIAGGYAFGDCTDGVCTPNTQYTQYPIALGCCAIPPPSASTPAPPPSVTDCSVADTYAVCTTEAVDANGACAATGSLFVPDGRPGCRYASGSGACFVSSCNDTGACASNVVAAIQYPCECCDAAATATTTPAPPVAPPSTPCCVQPREYWQSHPAPAAPCPQRSDRLFGHGTTRAAVIGATSPPAGSMCYLLGAQLVAAVDNRCSGVCANVVIDEAIDRATTLLATCCSETSLLTGQRNDVAPLPTTCTLERDAARRALTALFSALMAYNSGSHLFSPGACRATAAAAAASGLNVAEQQQKYIEALVVSEETSTSIGIAALVIACVALLVLIVIVAMLLHYWWRRDVVLYIPTPRAATAKLSTA